MSRDIYCLFRTEYDNGHIIFALIGVYLDKEKLLSDIKLLWTKGIREISHPDMCEMNNYTVETTKSQCHPTCRFEETRLAGYIIEKYHKDKINSNYLYMI